jgi:proteasome accessory factor C
MSNVADLVSLASFLVANDGISLRDAARATHRTPRQLVSDLDRLMMCGVPPYSPSDYVSYSLKGWGDRARIHVGFAEHFARPLNFKPQEALALKYALDHFVRGADGDTAAQLEELTRTLAEALHGRAREALASPGRGFITPRQTGRMRALIGTLTQAVEDQQLVEIDYYSSHRARLATRRVHPFDVMEIGAHFYLYAYCGLAEDTRHFRLDRIREARLVDLYFDESPPKKRRTGRMQPLFEGRPKDTLVVRFSATTAREVAEDWEGSPGVTIRQLKNGGLELHTPLYNPFWAIGFVMGFGGHARLLQPKWLRVDLAETIRKSLRAHR